MDSEIRKFSQRWIFKLRWDYHIIPTNEEITAYSKALIICAKADGTLAEAERDWVIGYIAAVGGSEDLIELLKNYDGNDNIQEFLLLSPAMAKIRKCLIYDAISACDADGDFNDAERAKVRSMGEILQLSQEDFEQIENLYFQSKELFTTRINLLFADGKPEYSTPR